MDINELNPAEKEASEVLHSLLPVERINKKQNWGTSDADHLNYSEKSSNEKNSNVWSDNPDHSDYTKQYESEAFISDIEEECKNLENDCLKKNETVKKKVIIRKKYSIQRNRDDNTQNIEESSKQVLERFKEGCECQDDSCFEGLNPDSVYRHRLNIAELTKEEHDMYLMGVTMACLSSPLLTAKHKERQRLRAHYVHQGRKVCLSAFLYLENCSLYQLKRIRKHVVTHGVTPRIHGNHGKKPHNSFSLDIYKRATEFLKEYLKKHNNGNLKTPTLLPTSKKSIHSEYETYVKNIAPADKIIGYSSFSLFLKMQFPHVKFAKPDSNNTNSSGFINRSTASNSSRHKTPKISTELLSPLKKQSAVKNVINQNLAYEPATVPVVFSSSSFLNESLPITEETVNKQNFTGQTFIMAPIHEIMNPTNYAQYQTVETITVTPASITFTAV